jgi:TolB-like protein/DNA-binding winged helix-turn-helix (wHTH) protein
MTGLGESAPTNYRFADLTLDVSRRSLTRNGEPIELKALDFDLLRFLVEQAPNVVNADILAEKVWGRHFVSPENVAQRVMLLRQSLSDDANKPRYIETVRNKGYRLIPVVETVPAAAGGGTPLRRRIVAIAAVLLLAIGLGAAASYWLASAARPPPSASSVAVLPFKNLSPGSDDAHFAAGMQVEIVSQLTKLRALRVIPVRPADDAETPIPEIARDLDVATVLGGSVYYLDGRVRVTPNLLEVGSGVSLWSETYDRELSDIFAIQSEIALEVARALSLELSAAERERIERVPTTDPQARDLYLMASTRNLFSPRESRLGIDEVERALEFDPESTEAWVLDAHLRCAAAQFTDVEHLDEHLSRAEHAARRALKLDSELGSAYAALGEILQAKRDWIGAERAFQTAMNLNVPATEMIGYAMLQLYAGKFSAFARDLLEEARAAAPQDENKHRFLAFTLEGRDETARAKELYDLGTHRFANDDATAARMLNQKMHWLVGRGQLEEARALPIADPLNAAMLDSLDDPPNARTKLRSPDATMLGQRTSHRDIALWAGHFGEPRLAFEAMRAATDERANQIAYAWLPQLAEMRRLPEFKAYLREIGMVDYWKEYGWPDICHELGKDDFQCE